MATTDQLIEESDRQWALVVLFSGIRPAFTTHADLVDYDVGTDHEVRLGLQREGLSCRLGVNLRDGKWLDSPATFVIDDLSETGDLAEIFAVVDPTARELGQVPIGAGLPVHPGDDLSSRTDLHDRYIGSERIGPAGERAMYPVPTDYPIGGDHSITTPELDIAGAPVTTRPVVWAGRRVELRIVFRDHIAYPDRDAGPSSWRPWSESRLVWRGVVDDQGVSGQRQWTIECSGPGALTRRPLFVGATPTPVFASGETTLVTTGDSREDGIYVALNLVDGLDIVSSFGIRDFATTITGATIDEIRADVQSEIDAAAALLGTDGVWEDQPGYHVSMDDQGAVSISVSEDGVGAGQLLIIAHRRVWALLGYDVAYQASLYPDEEEPKAVLFVSASPSYNLPGPDYYEGRFRTGEAEYSKGNDNNAITRRFEPLYESGTTVLLHGLNEGRGQIVRLADAALGGNTSQSTVAHPGQYALPIPSMPDDTVSPVEIDGVPCNRCGFWLFAGKRRMQNTDDVFDERWVGFASWVNGGAQQDGLVSGDTILVTRWLDPKLFGYNTPGGVDSDWVARDEADVDGGGLTVVPIAMLGWNADGLDRADLVLQRLLLTSGTSTGWDSPSMDDPAPVPGANEPAGDQPVLLDAEVPSLGLSIPSNTVATPADFQTLYESIGNAAILNVKSAFTAGYNAEDVLLSLMQPAGLAWHYRDGRMGVWQPHRRLTYADATVSLTPSFARVERQAAVDMQRLRQDMREWSPVDKFKISADWQPLERRTARNTERMAPDPEVRYRPGEAFIPITAHSMRGLGEGLAEVLLERARWYAMRHFAVRRYPVAAINPGLEIWPGTIAVITDPELFDPTTGYRVENRLAIVTGWQRSFAQNDAAMALDLLVLGDPSASPRVEAPMAQTWGFNAATGRLYTRDDWAGLGNGWNDAAYFEEPSYVGIDAIGGQGVVEVLQWDGTGWSVTLTGTVTGVSTTPGDSYLTLASTSGTYWRDMDGWVTWRPSTEPNAAWVEAIHSPIGNEDGEWVDDAAAPQSVYPWED